MEVDGSMSTSVVNDSAAGGGGAVMALHPLVILNISDQYTRQKAMAGAGGTVERVAGCIVGVTESRRIEIANSFEVPFVAGEDGGQLMDIGFLRTKIEQFKKVFPHYEFERLTPPLR